MVRRAHLELVDAVLSVVPKGTPCVTIYMHALFDCLKQDARKENASLLYG